MGFGTPVEVLALGLGVTLLVSAIPLVAAYIAGISLLWRGNLRPGDWVQVGDIAGEVTQIAFHEIRLVPEGGGVVDVPSLYLLLRPLRRLRDAPEVALDVTIARDRPARELVNAMRDAATQVVDEARVEAIDLCHAWIKVRVTATRDA